MKIWFANTRQWIWSQCVGLGRLCVPNFSPSPSPGDLLDARRITSAIHPAIILGLFVTGFACGQYWARGILWALSCIATGFFGGFLFGIPKVLQGVRSDEKIAERPRYQQRVNTNLEEISDWLTKIIAGLGLYQLSKIPGWIGILAGSFAASVRKDHDERGAFGGAIIFFGVSGFLLGYLLTRLYVQGALGRADRGVEPDEGNMVKKSEGEQLVESSIDEEISGGVEENEPNA